MRGGQDWARLMLAARGQAEAYAKDVPDDWPPFLLVCDIGFCFDLYADFSGTGKHYAQFPDRERFRIYLPDLHDADARERLRRVWLEPHSLDPSRVRAEVTRDIARLLAKLSRALEGSRGKPRHAPQAVATFLIRCIFCMFAQSVGLFPKPDTFTELLRACAGDPRRFVGSVGEFWRVMDRGGYSAAIADDLRHFNGGLFRAGGAHGTTEPLPVDADELALLISAAGKDWANVEPAIFGTLLEGALDAPRRAELGAHFTPRAFVERLVLPTIMEPLRAEWDGVKAAAVAADAAGKRDEAIRLLAGFHGTLASTRVLDPACGTGNFLYVALELMKRLEGEVLDLLATLGPGEGDRLALAGASVDPHNFLGLDKNPRAVPVAELVLWIGCLQWHFRTAGGPPPEPILHDFRNIRECDALLDYAHEVEERDDKGALVSRWDGVTTKRHSITGERVPDERARVVVMRPVGAKPEVWPEADFIVGNPPFMGGKDLRGKLGEGYTEALWAAYPKLPRSADLALFFWAKGAQAVAEGGVRRCGLITSNSLRQAFSRRIVAAALEARRPVHLAFAIPDHPWADGEGTAAVRIAMSVVAAGPGAGRLLTVTPEGDGEVPLVECVTREGVINADLTICATPDTARPLLANEGLTSRGMSLHGAGFIVTPAVARSLGLGRVPGLERHIRLYRNGRDLTQRGRDVMVIDLDGLSEEEVRRRFPATYQHVLTHVKPERDSNNEAYRRTHWWLFGRNNAVLRPALRGLPRYIATVETMKHRIFQFLDAAIIPDNMLVCVASDDAFHLGVLSSRWHTEWAVLAGGRLGYGNDPRYNKTLCFDPFPFPDATAAQRDAIAALAEELDALRKRVLAAHTQITLTGLYNVRTALAAGRPLTDAERDVHDAGEVSVLGHLHDRLDAAVGAAYGWPATLDAEAIVARVVALNAERRAEEETGLVRWLRPEYQAPETQQARRVQKAFDVTSEPVAMRAWPASTPGQFVALRAAMGAAPSDAAALARRFEGVSARRVRPMLETLAALGQIRRVGEGRYAA